MVFDCSASDASLSIRVSCLLTRAPTCLLVLRAKHIAWHCEILYDEINDYSLLLIDSHSAGSRKKKELILVLRLSLRACPKMTLGTVSVR